MTIDNGSSYTLVSMSVPHKAEVRAIIEDDQASLTLQTSSGLIQVEVCHIEKSGDKMLTKHIREAYYKH